MPKFHEVATSKDSQDMPSQIWDAALHATQNDIDNKWLTAAKVAVAGAAGFALADLVPGGGVIGTIGKVALAGAGTSFAFDIAPNLKHLSNDNVAQFCVDSGLLTGAAVIGYGGFKFYANIRATRAGNEVAALYGRNPQFFGSGWPLPHDAQSELMFGMSGATKNAVSITPRAKEIYWLEKALGTKVHGSLVPLYENLARAAEHTNPDFSQVMTRHAAEMGTKLKFPV
jgi:hypothetical protein